MPTTCGKSTDGHEVIHLEVEIGNFNCSIRSSHANVSPPPLPHIKELHAVLPSFVGRWGWVKSASTYPGYSRSEASTERVIVTSDGLVPLSPTLQIITTALDCLRLATTQQLQKDAKKMPVSAVPQMQAPKVAQSQSHYPSVP